MGYDNAHEVNLLNYTDSNPYTAPKDGIIRIKVTYRMGAYTITTVKTGSTTVDFACASPNTVNYPSNPTQVIPVFKGQQMWAIQNSVGFCSSDYIPFLYA